MANWKKTTPYGDYSDPLQNHKFDKDLHFTNEELHTVIIRTKRHEILHQCRTLGTHGKHVGSKPIKTLLGALRKVSEAGELYKRLKAASA